MLPAAVSCWYCALKSAISALMASVRVTVHSGMPLCTVPLMFRYWALIKKLFPAMMELPPPRSPLTVRYSLWSSE